VDNTAMTTNGKICSNVQTNIFQMEKHNFPRTCNAHREPDLEEEYPPHIQQLTFNISIKTEKKGLFTVKATS
jgi:hypothetical protein